MLSLDNVVVIHVLKLIKLKPVAKVLFNSGVICLVTAVMVLCVPPEPCFKSSHTKPFIRLVTLLELDRSVRYVRHTSNINISSAVKYVYQEWKSINCAMNAL